MHENQEFSYGIAKFSQGLRKFHNPSENFAVIAKITVHSEILNFRNALDFRYHSEIHCA